MRDGHSNPPPHIVSTTQWRNSDAGRDSTRERVGLELRLISNLSNAGFSATNVSWSSLRKRESKLLKNWTHADSFQMETNRLILGYDSVSDGGSRRSMMTLDTVGVHRQARVIMIEGGQRVRSHLNTLGIHIGDWLTVVQRAPFRGPVLVEVHGTRVALGRGIAGKVQVDMDGVFGRLSGPAESVLDDR
jgi:ferrous iron transport protein A